MQENPVLTREVRARWRRPMTVVSFCCYAGLLAWIGVWAYDQAIWSANTLSGYSGDEFASGLGQQLFYALSVLQLCIASLFAAALAAPTIVSERESGTLQILRTTPLTIRSVVYGKFFSALLVMLLLIFIPLPVISQTFVMGGVSAPEFFMVAAIQLASGAVCASIGTYSSAISRTGFTALVRAVFLSVFTLGVPGVLIAAALTAETFVWLAFALALAVAFAAFCLAKATRRIEEEFVTPLPDGIHPPYVNWQDGPGWAGAPHTEHSHRARQAAWEHSRLDAQRAAAASGAAPWRRTPVLTPIGRALRFANPVLRKHVLHQFRYFTRAPQDEWKERAALLEVMGTAWVLAMLWAVLPVLVYGKPGGGLEWMRLAGALAVLYATLDAATSFSRERSQNMLTSLLLTPLSPREVAVPKRDAALAAALIGFLLSVPLFASACLSNSANAFAHAYLWIALMALGSSLGLLFGWLCRSAGLAVALALSALLGLYLAGNWALEGLQGLIRFYGTALAQMPGGEVLIHLIRPSNGEEKYLASLAGLVIVFALRAPLLWPVLHGLRPATLERAPLDWPGWLAAHRRD